MYSCFSLTTASVTTPGSDNVFARDVVEISVFGDDWIVVASSYEDDSFAAMVALACVSGDVPGGASSFVSEADSNCGS